MPRHHTLCIHPRCGSGCGCTPLCLSRRRVSRGHPRARGLLFPVGCRWLRVGLWHRDRSSCKVRARSRCCGAPRASRFQNATMWSQLLCRGLFHLHWRVSGTDEDGIGHASGSDDNTRAADHRRRDVHHRCRHRRRHRCDRHALRCRCCLTQRVNQIGSGARGLHVGQSVSADFPAGAPYSRQRNLAIRVCWPERGDLVRGGGRGAVGGCSWCPSKGELRGVSPRAERYICGGERCGGGPL